MPGGRKNPISLTNFVEKVEDVVNTATGNAHDLAKVTKAKVNEQLDVPCVDLTIKVCISSGQTVVASNS